jgi:sulfotransferase
MENEGRINKVAFLAGLPRSGSTILANILGMHPEIKATASSPLCNIVQSMRKAWSNDQFFKAQLDKNFDEMNQKAHQTTMAAIRAWSWDQNKSVTVDKCRGWLHCIEWLRDVMPNFKMIVPIRDLRDVYTSVEKQHRKTLLLDFPDNMEHDLVDVRANALFNDGGIIGSPLKAMYNIGDIPDITRHLLIWRYEDFLKNPQEVMDKTFNFLEVDPITIDFENIVQNMKKDFLEETGVIKNLRYNDEFLRPYMVSNCNYDIMMGSAGTCSPFRYELNYRNFLLLTQGTAQIKLAPPHSIKYLYPNYDYENFEFKSPVNPWSPQAKFQADFDKIKCLEFTLTPGKTLYLPAYWWYSIKFNNDTSISFFRYRTYLNNLAIIPYIAMHALQIQNVKRNTVKKVSIQELNNEIRENVQNTVQVPSTTPENTPPSSTENIVSPDNNILPEPASLSNNSIGAELN